MKVVDALAMTAAAAREYADAHDIAYADDARKDDVIAAIVTALAASDESDADTLHADALALFIRSEYAALALYTEHVAELARTERCAKCQNASASLMFVKRNTTSYTARCLTCALFESNFVQMLERCEINVSTSDARDAYALTLHADNALAEYARRYAALATQRRAQTRDDRLAMLAERAKASEHESADALLAALRTQHESDAATS